MTFHTTWESPHGALVTAKVRGEIDTQALAVLYDAEVGIGTSDFNAVFNATNNATRYAWKCGYRNPRVSGRVAECEARL